MRGFSSLAGSSQHDKKISVCPTLHMRKSNVTLLLPGRLLNPASSSLPHVADFNGIRHGWDLRDPQERSLVAERVRAGLRNARAKGKRLGRPRKIVDMTQIATLRAQGVGWKRIATLMGVGVGTLYRVVSTGSKTREKAI